jgi:hypothetical protein
MSTPEVSEERSWQLNGTKSSPQWKYGTLMVTVSNRSGRSEYSIERQEERAGED